jgi:hypothetical protein
MPSAIICNPALTASGSEIRIIGCPFSKKKKKKK